ncbi:MAG: hypothetical protein EBV35_08845 [Betaproteobacteria bacterium]|nr:hypothetical protein [Betaproteobacteria bacterium]
MLTSSCCGVSSGCKVSVISASSGEPFGEDTINGPKSAARSGAIEQPNKTAAHSSARAGESG